MTHTYEEIRLHVVRLLKNSSKTTSQSPYTTQLGLGKIDQFDDLLIQVSIEVYGAQGPSVPRRAKRNLPNNATLIVQEVFWDLFREGIITLGNDNFSQGYPYFRVSTLGNRILEESEEYFFLDLSQYEAEIRKKIPRIDDITVIYLKEAMQSFRAGCVLSSSVMLGVATEHTFDLLIEAVNSSSHSSDYKSVGKKYGLLNRVNEYKKILDQKKKGLDRKTKQDLETHFMGILSLIRNYRNESGHPSGEIVSREQCFVLLQLFILFARKMYQLIDYYESA